VAEAVVAAVLEVTVLRQAPAWVAEAAVAVAVARRTRKAEQSASCIIRECGGQVTARSSSIVALERKSALSNLDHCRSGGR